MTADITYKVKDDGKSYRFNYRVAAIIEVDEKILAHKFLEADYWFLPGGRVKLGEIAQDAIVRELKEELDIDASVSSFPFIVENLFNFSDELFHEICLFFKVDTGIYTLPNDNEIRGNVQFNWINKNNIANYNLQPHFLKDALNHITDQTQHIINRNNNLDA